MCVYTIAPKIPTRYRLELEHKKKSVDTSYQPISSYVLVDIGYSFYDKNEYYKSSSKNWSLKLKICYRSGYDIRLPRKNIHITSSVFLKSRK